MLLKTPFWVYFYCVAQFCNRVTQSLYLDFWTLVIFEPLRIQQRTGESPRAREVPGFCLTKFHAVVAKTEASRCSSGRLQWTAKIINSMKLIWGWQYLPLSERWWMWEGWEQPLPWGCCWGWGLRNERLKSTTGDFCFPAFSPSSFLRCFSPLQSLLCPLGFVLQVPVVERSWGAEALPGVGASIRAECVLPQFGQAPELLFKPHVVS